MAAGRRKYAIMPNQRAIRRRPARRYAGALAMRAARVAASRQTRVRGAAPERYEAQRARRSAQRAAYGMAAARRARALCAKEPQFAFVFLFLFVCCAMFAGEQPAERRYTPHCARAPCDMRAPKRRWRQHVTAVKNQAYFAGGAPRRCAGRCNQQRRPARARRAKVVAALLRAAVRAARACCIWYAHAETA